MIVLLVTLILFTLALFLKGLTHDLFLEAGVFLVSMKLIIMAFKSSSHARETDGKLREIQDSLARLESRLREDRPRAVSEFRPEGTNEMQTPATK
jgi:hypothetical protein